MPWQLRRQWRRPAGILCFCAGLVGALQAVLIIAWPDATSEARYSYPFTSTGYVIAQISFFLQHLPLVAGLVALLSLPAVGRSRPARIGTIIATIGMLLLAAMELVATSAASVATDSTRAETINALYGPPVLLIGLGLVVAGVALLRSDPKLSTGPAWLRWVPLLLGVWVFLALLPALMGPLVAGRLAIGGWMLLFAALGLGLSQPKATLSSPAAQRTVAQPGAG